MSFCLCIICPTSIGGGGYSLHIPHNNSKFTSSCDRYVLLYPFDFQIWLIEINVNPALHTNCQVLRDMLPSMVDETLSKSHDPDSSLSLMIFVMIFFFVALLFFSFWGSVSVAWPCKFGYYLSSQVSIFVFMDQKCGTLLPIFFFEDL